MARIPRKLLIETADVGVYHCINRCVRRAFLCGTDEVSGKCFDHRKQWIQDRLEFLAGEFGVDVMAFAVMSNHLHLVLRNRPDVVAAWSDEEVAQRWWRLFPSRRDDDGSPAQPTKEELFLVLNNAERLTEIRSRLSSVSWFMRCVAEPIARQSNREDECTGRFWEGRYRCQPLLDESAVLACMAYVDLNPIRAEIAATPETSRFTSVFERIMAERGIERESVEEGTNAEMRAKSFSEKEKGGQECPSYCGEWLSPLALGNEVAAVSSPAGLAGNASDEEPKAVKSKAVPGHRTSKRASNKGCLPMSLAEYLQLLDWTGHQLRRDGSQKVRDGAPSYVALTLQRLKITEECWLKLVKDFNRLFPRAAGTPATLATEATRRGRRWLKGIGPSRTTFA